MLTRLLNVSAYASFAAGQGLILWASSVATVSVPWALAQGLARARSDAERDAALRFSMLASIGSGVLAAAIVGAIATRFGDLLTALAVALSTLAHLPGHHDHRLAAGPAAHARRSPLCTSRKTC